MRTFAVLACAVLGPTALLAQAVLTQPERSPERSVRTDTEHTQVLVVHSLRRDAQISILAERELARALGSGPTNIDYYSEFIDQARFADPQYRASFGDFLRVKYQGVRFDLVIALQDAALALVTEYRQRLFPDTAIVFLTNNKATLRLVNSTGLIHERNFTATVAFIRQLQPDVRNVFVVTGAGPDDKNFENSVRRQLQSFDAELTLIYLSGLKTRELEERLSRLPQHSAVYYVLVSEDGTGQKFHPLEYLSRVVAAASAPTYSWVDSTMGRGIVGGGLYSQSGVIDRVGELARRVLRGEAAADIPIEQVNLNAYQADWRHLRRWHIDESRVPPGTVVNYREVSLWERYKYFIVGVVMIVTTQGIFIAGLLIQRRRRRRAEDELRKSQGELLTSLERNRDLGARVLRAREDEHARIAGELHDDICQRMLLLTFALETIGRQIDQQTTAEALRVARDISKSLHELSHRLYPTQLRLIGLVAALGRLCDDLSRTGIKIVYSHDDVPLTLRPDAMLCLFRVAQEAIQNAIKHSGATELLVRLSNRGSGLALMITDNGAGFDVNAAWRKGIGLVSMVERLEAVGGSLEISSARGGGTRVTATISFLGVHGNDSAPSDV